MAKGCGDEELSHCLHWRQSCPHHAGHDVERCCECGGVYEINPSGEIVTVVRAPE